MRARLATLTCVLAAFALPASASSLISDGHNDAHITKGTHTLSLQCNTSKTAYLMSRLAVLDVGIESPHDIAVTTGHGLIDSAGDKLSDCTVRDFKGNAYKVISTKVAPNYAPGTPDDWAVITFEKARKTPLVRYALAAPLKTKAFDSLAETNLSVRFSSARGLPSSGQDCAMLPRSFAGFEPQRYSGLIPHDCRAVSGQSGAPISVTRDGHNVIIGIHVGHSFLLESPHADGPTRYGYMRVFDDHLRDHVNAIIMDLTETESRQ